VYTCDGVAPIGADNHVVFFGNWARGYLLVERTGMEITVDQVTNPGYTRFYVRRRIGGCVLNNDAIKCLTYADS
jgi:HK97 family phage major capsid protein